MKLRKFVIPEILFGEESLALAGHYILMSGGRRILLVTDGNVQNCPWFNTILESLHDADVEYELFRDISPNSRDFEIMNGADAYHNARCDALLAVGGGSVIDAAKGIGIVVNNGGHILDYEGIDKIENPIPPLVCIPTTCGSSADVSQFAIINDTGKRRKVAIVSKALVPDISLIDPETLFTLDREMFIAASLDTLSHAVEAYVSTASSLLTDRHALGAIELLGMYLFPALEDRKNPELQSAVMNASMEAGLAFSNASLGMVHAMSHVLGGYKDFPHGICNGLLLRGVCTYNYETCSERYDTIAALLARCRGRTPETGLRGILNELEYIAEKTGIEDTVSSFRLTPDECRILAEMSLKDVCNATNPREPVLEDVNELFERTFC